jgi:hypothetical protein
MFKVLKPTIFDNKKIIYMYIAYCGTQCYNVREIKVARLAKPPRVIVFADKDGKEPFTEWLYGLKDVMGRKRILVRITRLAILETVNRLVRVLVNYECSLGLAIGFISGKMQRTLLSCSVAATKGARHKTSKRQKPIGGSI